MYTQIYHDHRLQYLFVYACMLPLCLAYLHYGERIPNGDRVPNPALPNILWKGVGHKNTNGGGARNPFGKDFSKNDHVSITFSLKYNSPESHR